MTKQQIPIEIIYDIIIKKTRNHDTFLCAKLDKLYLYPLFKLKETKL